MGCEKGAKRCEIEKESEKKCVCAYGWWERLSFKTKAQFLETHQNWNAEKRMRNGTKFTKHRLVLYNNRMDMRCICVCVCACYVCARMNEWDSKCAFHVKKNLHHQTFNYLYKCEKQKAEQDEKRNHQDIFGVCWFETKNFAHRRPTPPMPCRSLRETHIFSKTQTKQ